MTEIIPSILVKTEKEFQEKIRLVEPYVERVHLDIADGIFVSNTTILGFNEVDRIDTKLKIGVHLMVSKPENHIVRWVETQADKFIFHIEATSKANEIINLVKDSDKEVGIALNPQTPIKRIESHINDVDFIHFMSVEPGFYGGEFIESVIDKISEFHFMYPDKLIEVDGGVNPENTEKLVDAGVSMLVVGGYIFDNDSIERAIQELKTLSTKS